VTFDLVHDTQAAYRTVLDAMSRPGKVVSLAREAEKIDLPDIAGPAARVLMRMLLDPEVGFCVAGPDHSRIESRISQLTGSFPVSLPQADFIFVLEQASEKECREAMLAAKIGSLTDPHLSATLVVELPLIGDGGELWIAGPGVAGRSRWPLTQAASCLDERNQKIEEFPLGIDLLFVDRSHQLVALPRTSRLFTKSAGSGVGG